MSFWHLPSSFILQPASFMKSNIALILSAHLPYMRAPGREHAGEEPIHELLAYVLLPTLNTLYDLHDLRLPVRVGLAYSPVLLEQLGDPVVLKHFGFWLEERLGMYNQTLHAAEQDGDTERVYLARFFREWAEGIGHSFDARFGLNPLAALRQLCEDGVVEPLVSVATFPRLSNIGQPSTLRAQIELGTLAVARTLGTHGQGFWPPSLRYRRDADLLLSESGIHYVVMDASEQQKPNWLLPHKLVAFTRDNRFDSYLTNADLSYAGDPLYLAPARDAGGLTWTRNAPQGTKLYDPYDAYRRVLEHANHFAEVLAEYSRQPSAPQLSVLALDAETIGVSWFEGAAWLRALLERLANHSTLTLTTPGEWLHTSHQHGTRVDATPIEAAPQIGSLFSLQRLLHAAETRISALARRFPDARDEHERMIDQAARELLLAQSNDIAPGASYEAPRRAMRHLARCTELCDLAERGNFEDADLVLLETLEEEDNSFAYLNYRMFA